MDVVVAFRDRDGGYVRHVAAMLASLLAAVTCSLRVHVLHDETLAPASAQRLATMAQRAGQQLRLHALDPRRCLPGVDEGSPIMQPLTFATLYRLFIPTLPELAACPRLLYLDTDIIVDIDLEELWNTDLGDALLGAVPDPCLNGALTRTPTDARSRWAHDVARYSLRHGIPMSRYFNAGVLLLDMRRIVEQGLFTQAADIVLGNPNLLHPDQDALNKVFFGRSLFVPEKFNYLLHTVDVSDKERGVWHYSGPDKPWNTETQKAGRYRFFAAQTPWADAPIPPDTPGANAGEPT